VTTPESLFTLFGMCFLSFFSHILVLSKCLGFTHDNSLPLGVYGDVHRVKILFNKKDSALIQFATPQQAAVGKKKRKRNQPNILNILVFFFLAHQNLDHVTMFGKPIRVSFSKHQFVQMPKDGTSVKSSE